MTPFKLFGRVDSASSVDERDTLQTKSALGELGYYKLPRYGMTSFPDEPMFDGIRAYQRANNLRIDGVMKPGGETQTSLNRRLAASPTFWCRVCSRPHGGVYSPSVCWECYGKGYR